MLKNKNLTGDRRPRRFYNLSKVFAVFAFALATFYPFSPANAQRGDFDVQTVDKNFAGGGTGAVEICKQASGAGLENRIFRFTITGVAAVIEVPIGGCSSPIDVPAGIATVTELESGRIISGGTFSGGFSMVGVETISQNSPSSVGTVNLRARTVQVNVVEGNISQLLTLQITNTYAVNSFVEICHNQNAAPSGAAGLATYTIAGTPGQFIVPPNMCSGPIMISLPSSPGAPPVGGSVKITQLSNPGFALESATTVPADRFNNLTRGTGINTTKPECLNAPDPLAVSGCTFSNTGGGYADVDVVEGNPAQMTAVYFTNRAVPARLLKICKIAGAGVQIGTPFTFDFYINNETEIGAAPITVPAGSAIDGGFCIIADGQSAPFLNEFGSFPANSKVTVVERAASGVATSSIISPHGGMVSNVNLSQRKATITIADGMNTLEFTNTTTAPVSAPTAAGTNVSVVPINNLNLNFSNVTSAGTTTVTIIPPGETAPAPPSFAFVGSSLMYNITTSAAFSGNLTVAFSVLNVADTATCNRLRILHFTANNWDASGNAVPRYDSATRTCALAQTVNSLSPFAVAEQLAPTAASASIKGRALTTNGRGIANVVITLTDADGAVRTATTTSFGHYAFNDVAAGETYIITAKSKRVAFSQNSRVLSVGEDVQNADFIGTLR